MSLKTLHVSDFHSDFFASYRHPKIFKAVLELYLPPHPDDKDTVLCCAGDMGLFHRYFHTYKLLFKYLSARFKFVICVPGNHSWDHSVGLWGKEKAFWKKKVLPKNVFYLDNDYTIIEDVVFIGSCLWTDFNNDILAINHAKSAVEHLSTIRHGIRRMGEDNLFISETTPLELSEIVEKYRTSVEAIKSMLNIFRGKKCVVITHFAPSVMSIKPHYQGDLLNSFFANNLEDVILHYQPVIWHHGHNHHVTTYFIDQTEVICNALGYHGSPSVRHFDPRLLREI